MSFANFFLGICLFKFLTTRELKFQMLMKANLLTFSFVVYILLVSCRRTFYLTLSHKGFLLCSLLKVSQCSVLFLGICLVLSYILCKVWGLVDFFFFCILISNCSNTICWNCFCAAIKIHWPHLGGLISRFAVVIHDNLSILLPVPHCLDQCSYIVTLKIRSVTPVSLFFF